MTGGCVAPVGLRTFPLMRGNNNLSSRASSEGPGRAGTRRICGESGPNFPHLFPVTLCSPMFDKLHEECGVFGVLGRADAANLVYLGLYALQHRGQESAGIASVNAEGRIISEKEM